MLLGTWKSGLFLVHAGLPLTVVLNNGLVVMGLFDESRHGNGDFGSPVAWASTTSWKIFFRSLSRRLRQSRTVRQAARKFLSAGTLGLSSVPSSRTNAFLYARNPGFQ